MNTEIANLTVINHTVAKKVFVRQPIETMRGLAQFGFKYECLPSGLLAVQANSRLCPVVVVADDERFVSAQQDNRKHKILGFTPREWIEHGLVMLNHGWEHSSMAADIVLQTAVLDDQLDGNLEASASHLGSFQEPVQEAYRRFTCKDLHLAYRANFLRWMMQE